MRTIAMAATLLLATACTVGATDPVGGDDGDITPDAGTDPAASCYVDESLGDLGLMDLAEASQVNQSGSMGALKVYRLNADLNADEEYDVLSLQLWDERGAFVGPAEPGTYTIGGEETNFNTCGVCATVLGNIVPMQGARQFYIAQSGTITIDSISPTFSGSITGLTLQEFDLNTGAAIADGCTTVIDNASFSAELQILDQ
jgi:hypothetical protein